MGYERFFIKSLRFLGTESFFSWIRNLDPYSFARIRGSVSKFGLDPDP